MITKSVVIKSYECRKKAYLSTKSPDKAAPLSDDQKAVMEEGVKIGKLGREYFGPYTDMTAYIPGTSKPDIQEMVRRTQEAMATGTSVICEATFTPGDLCCSVDILLKQPDGWDIIEVKSATAIEDTYLPDVAFQKYVLEQCGVPVRRACILHPNNEYIRRKNLDIHGYFTLEDVTMDILPDFARMPALIDSVRNTLSSGSEPNIDFCKNCKKKTVLCPFWNYCARYLPSPSVFNLRKMNLSTKIALYSQGKASFTALETEDRIAKGKTAAAAFQRIQIDTVLHHPNDAYTDLPAIRSFLSRISYPLYFLDFETTNEGIPPYENTRAYQQIPFQYSLHIKENANVPLKHLEFLAESGPDPRPALAEQICHDIPKNVTVIAYNASFERGRLAELAEVFPQYRDHLLNIQGSIVDLEDPFKDCSYYRKEQGGSTSIKHVLPAICPNDPSLDYTALEGVHNGAEAKTIFPQIQHMPPEEQQKARQNLLKYCCLDTLAMVKIWEELVRITQ